MFRRRLLNSSSQEKPLTITSLADDNTIGFTVVSGRGSLYMRVNKGPWVEGDEVTINKGDVVDFRGNIYSIGGSLTSPAQAYCSKEFNLSGDCTAVFNEELLISMDYMFYNTPVVAVSSDFLSSLEARFCSCRHMFANCFKLTIAPELPSAKLGGSDYMGMFLNCTSLITAPSLLPATTLANRCYDSMFEGCTSLTTAPELPATTLAVNCYDSMFEGCTSLTTAPTLPATTLADYCYGNMFQNCSKLNYIKMLATDISATGCLTNWVSNVASTGTFVKNPDATWEVYGASGIPYGWTVVMDGEEDKQGGEFYCRCVQYHPMTGAVMKDTTYTFEINGTATWKDCNGLYDNTNSVYIDVGILPNGKTVLSIVDSKRDEEVDIAYLPSNISVTDNIIFGETYTFEY